MKSEQNPFNLANKKGAAGQQIFPGKTDLRDEENWRLNFWHVNACKRKRSKETSGK